MGHTLKSLHFTFKRKSLIIVFVGMTLLVTALFSRSSAQSPIVDESAKLVKIIDTQDVESLRRLTPVKFENEQEAIYTEIYYGELELLALVIQAEAGNQDELGKRYVADVVMNRVNSKAFPDTIREVIYQKNPVQFACVYDGALDRAGYTITEDCFKIAEEEYWSQQNTEIVYFRTQRYHNSGHPAFKYGDHYFSTK